MAARIETATKNYHRIADVYKFHPYRNDILTISNSFVKILIAIVMAALV